MEVTFSGTVTNISAGIEPTALGITFLLESGTGIVVQVPKANEGDFKIGTIYNFVGNLA